MELYEKYRDEKEEKKITINRIKEHIRPASWQNVRVKEMGDTVELRYISDLNPNSMGGIIKKLNKDEYYNTITGKVCRFNHNERRIQNKNSIKKSLQRLREIINCNVTKETRKNCLWVTLTYANPCSLLMSECYHDYKLYNMRFQNYLSKKGFEKAEYICVIEPQGRVVEREGKDELCVWHFHIIYIFPSTRPYIPNADIERLWGLGFTSTKAVRSDNFGQYLGAYLSNVQVEDSKNPNNKKIIKGERLKYYFSYNRLYRLSRRHS